MTPDDNYLNKEIANEKDRLAQKVAKLTEADRKYIQERSKFVSYIDEFGKNRTAK